MSNPVVGQEPLCTRCDKPEELCEGHNCGVTNSCSGCGKDHEDYECYTGFNSPCDEECKHE